jgi:FtsP/CotA-like multicopper oxidase with cupredoxin domain
MSRNQRFALIGLAVAVAVAAFLIARPDEDDNNGTPAGTTPAEGTTETAPRAATTEIAIGKGRPLGGIHRIKIKKGERVRLTVHSPDTASEVHVHGYDLMKDMRPGRPASFTFPADIEGVFEIELEDTKTQIAQLQVEPR